MSKKTQPAFHTTELGRAKRKRHFMKAFVDKNLKQPRRHHTDTGMVMDRTSPAVVVRVIFGLIILHLLVIGGVMLRGNIGKSNRVLAVTPTIAPPPATPATQPQAAPVQPLIHTQTEPAPAQPAPAADTQVHITQSPVKPEDVTAVTAEQPVEQTQTVVVQQPDPAASAQPTVELKHLVQSGDTWGQVAAKFGITEDVLKGANTQLAALSNLPAGAYLSVPVPADSAAAKNTQTAQAAATPAAPETPEYHIIKRGDSMGAIARKYKIPLNKLRKMNNMTPADDRRLQLNQKIKIRE